MTNQMNNKRMNKKKSQVFQALAEAPRKTKKWFFFSVSLMVHGVLLAALVISPMLAAGSMPTVTYINANLINVPALPKVPNGKPQSTGKKTVRKTKPKPVKPKPRPVQTQAFVAPTVIPDTIQEEELTAADIGGGGMGVIGAPYDPNQEDTNSPMDYNTTGGPNNNQVVTVVTKPKLIRSAAPNYPRVAEKSQVQGAVVVRAVTDIYGRVIEARAVSGHPLLKKAAIDAVKKWVYEPYIISGIPKPVSFVVTIRFNLKN